jgi:hypothetical protein
VGGGSVGLAAMVEVEVVAAQKVAPCLLLSCVAQAGTRVRVEPGRNNFLAAGDTSTTEKYIALLTSHLGPLLKTATRYCQKNTV